MLGGGLDVLEGSGFGVPRFAGDPVEAFQDVAGSLRHEEIHGLGQQEQQDDENAEGADAAENEDGTPAVLALEVNGCGTSKGRADAVSGGVDADAQSTALLGGVFAGDDVGAGKDAADAQSCQETPDAQLRHVAGSCGQQHAGAGGAN